VPPVCDVIRSLPSLCLCNVCTRFVSALATCNVTCLYLRSAVDRVLLLRNSRTDAVNNSVFDCCAAITRRLAGTLVVVAVMSRLAGNVRRSA
jgi:hypothetical protein